MSTRYYKCIAEEAASKMTLGGRYPKDPAIRPASVVWCDIMNTFTYFYKDGSYVINDNFRTLDWGIANHEIGLDSGHNGG